MSGLGNKDIMSKNIKKYIEISGKTRKELSNILGVPYSTFTDWCNGKIYPRIDKIEKMANYFGIEKSDLIEDKEQSNIIGNGELFRKLLLEKNVTIMEVAKEIHIPEKELRQYELGLKRIPFDVIKKLADYFDVDITTLKGFEVRGGNNNFNTSVRLLEMTDRWSKEIGHVEFTDEELTQLINYAKFILSQRKG